MKNYFPTSLCLISIKNTISFVVFLLVSFSINAQNLEKKLSKADQVFKSYAYVDARAIYLDVAQKGYSSPSLYSKLADSFYFTGNLEDSVEWYKKLIQLYPEDLNPEYLFRYAQSLKSVERYKEADTIMHQFYTITKNDKRANFFAKKRDYLDFIKMQSDKFELYPLNINSKNSEYSPSFNYQNQIVFASSREKNNTFKLHEWDEMPFLDLFASNIQEDNITLDDPVKLKGKINTRFHESSTSFSKDGKTVYFSRNNYLNHKLGKSKKGVVLLKLYKATLHNGSWENITELPFCSDDYSVSHPSLSLDGKKLYFASDMPGTFGQSDLFVVDILGDNQYSNPKNLGSKINTEGRETFPYISNNGTLYFSSDGHIGLGGLDIFVSVPDEYGFSDSYNVGRPINSPKDDFTFILNEETKIGYFASNRKGGKGNDDIYSFKQTEELITSCMQYIEGTITNNTTGNPLTSADIVLLNKNEDIIREIISDTNGNYRFKVPCNENYTLKVKSKNFMPRDILAETTDAFEFINEINISLINKEKLLSTTIEINVGDDLTKILQLEPIYFGLNDAIITTETEVELQKIISIMNKYPDLKIEVRSHTDSRSSYWYNKKLSVQRMRATVKYITEKGGINWRRVRGKAYGERRLLNKCTDDIPCTEEEHQENRRSEFIVRK
ncbi:OmpA family protein [Aquimarina muelleri]|uniref:Cell envelope biogenesis protein OmpA n=1 Tax=Aquimarina muelleri TaxID=279356 RepID=A0A918JW83_9FLAO|nr:OmpA family protein [Aquimarina muelleri]MCX2762575.1 OmpA family protein [Aquimarina muelleri]GGX24097.1 cell envelope biogenesis protein OmpA [Aquimarina muelleri]